MQVVATKVGFHGVLRQEGDTFDVPDGAKASWFAKVPGKEPEPAPAAKPAKAAKPAADAAAQPLA